MRIAALILWFAVGVSYGFGIAALLSVGVLFLLVATAGTALLAWRPSTRSGWPAVICGPAIVLLYIAYLNRNGPGTVCTRTGSGGQSCADEYAPWPFVAAAVLLIVVGAALAVGLARRSGTTRDSAAHRP
jgi:hypothetical protein